MKSVGVDVNILNRAVSRVGQMRGHGIRKVLIRSRVPLFQFLVLRSIGQIREGFLSPTRLDMQRPLDHPGGQRSDDRADAARFQRFPKSDLALGVCGSNMREILSDIFHGLLEPFFHAACRNLGGTVQQSAFQHVDLRDLQQKFAGRPFGYARNNSTGKNFQILVYLIGFLRCLVVGDLVRHLISALAVHHSNAKGSRYNHGRKLPRHLAHATHYLVGKTLIGGSEALPVFFGSFPNFGECIRENALAICESFQSMERVTHARNTRPYEIASDACDCIAKSSLYQPEVGRLVMREFSKIEICVFLL